MATRYISKGYPVPDGVASANGFAFDSNDTLKVNRVDAVGVADTGYVPINRAQAKTTSFTVTKADHGKTFVFDSTTSVVATLPSTVAGLRFTFAVKQLTSSGGHAVSPAAADKIMGNGFTSADNKDAICTAATDREGDMLTIEGDGVDGWFIIGVTGTWAREA